MTRFTCDDGNGDVDIEAASPQEAAQKYVDEGEWGVSERTTWVTVHVWEEEEQ